MANQQQLQSSTAPVPPRRGPGKPKQGQPVVTPAMLDRIEKLWLQGWSKNRIAKALNVTQGTVDRHFREEIQPRLQKANRITLEEEVEKINNVEQTAWAKFLESCEPQEKRQVEKVLSEAGSDPRTVKRVLTQVKCVGDTKWLNIVQWCIEQRLKIQGLYAAEKLHIEGGLRVAGASPTELDGEMMRRLREGIVKRQKEAELN